MLLDALGTLLELEPPWPLLVAGMAERGIALDEETARRALLAEMAYYRAEHGMARDRERLAQLRAACTEVLRSNLTGAAAALPAAELQAALLASLRFRPYPEVPGVLRGLRAAGKRLVVVSNWDVSLHDVMASTGLAGSVDAVLTSAEEGFSKPDPRLFGRALETAGAAAAEALHVGDSVEHDLEGARAAGVRAVLVVRDGSRPGALPAGVRAIASLRGLPALAR